MATGPYYFPKEKLFDDNRVVYADVCVYGGTAAGVVAAVTVAGRGKRVVLLNPAERLGGMSSGGLSYTDVGNMDAVGGRAREFFRAVGKYYGRNECWTGEPHVAELIFNQWIRDAGVDVYPLSYIADAECTEARINKIRMVNGLTVEARHFIDASYEGDLMARAGVSCTVGREGNDQYGESLNGAQVHQTHQFDVSVDPYVDEGVPGSGLLPFVDHDSPAPVGTRDGRIQAYCFRVCMTADSDNRTPFPKPERYNPMLYALAERWLRRTSTDIFKKFDAIEGKKTDTNNHGAVSTDFIGANYAWPEAGYEMRETIFQQHVAYQQGLHWFMANDPAVPVKVRDRYAEWGLARDEFEETGNWPHQLYIREARRMLSDYVITEHDCRSERKCEDPVGMGAYQMDSHNCRRCVRGEAVVNEGDVQFPLSRPYPISRRAIMPRREESENLLVPVCVSASHIAFGSVRMEPVFMILGESAAIAASLALDNRCAVQDVPYNTLKVELIRAGQVLECETSNRGDGNPHTLVEPHH